MNFKITAFALLAITGFQSCKSTQDVKSEVSTVLSKDQKAAYAVGSMLGENMKKSGVDSIDVKFVSQAISDVLYGDSLLITTTERDQLLKDFFQEVQQKQALKEKAKFEGNIGEGENFLTANESKEGVKSTPSGLQYKILKPGIGAYPKATDKVEVHYEGKLLNGKVFDSSFERGQTIQFGLNQVIKGWTEGMQYINEGGEIELYIPYQLAYGEKGAGKDIPPYSTLIFRVQLVSIVKPAPAHNPNDGQDHSGHNH